MNNYIIRKEDRNLQSDTINSSSAMKAIAEGKNLDNQALLDYTNIDSNKQQFQMFIVAQAKRELHRALRLSELLDKVEQKYEERIEEQIDQLPTEALADVMSTMMGCIDRSNSIISSTIRNKEMLQLLIVDNSINVGSNNTEVTAEVANDESNPTKSFGLDSAASRRRVIDAVKTALSVLENKDNIIEVNPNE